MTTTTAKKPGKHPATFTPAVLDDIRAVLDKLDFMGTIVDPFAGDGGIHKLAQLGRRTIGIELEPEGVAKHPDNYLGDANHMLFDDGTVDAIVTSPVYGNRFADKDMRESCAGTYMKWLQREASEGSSCHLQWGPKYREFHERFLAEAWRVLRKGGEFIVNMSDHYRGDEVQRVVDWWIEASKAHGFDVLENREVTTPRMRKGANAKRVDHENVIVMRKAS